MNDSLKKLGGLVNLAEQGYHGDEGKSPIAKKEFDALVKDVVEELKEFGVSDVDYLEELNYVEIFWFNSAYQFPKDQFEVFMKAVKSAVPSAGFKRVSREEYEG